VLVQEVTAGAFADLRRRFEWGMFSLDLRRDRVREISPNGHGVAVLGSSQLAPRRRPYLLEHFVAPWKMPVADVALTRHRGYFTGVSYHALNGVCGKGGFDKPRLTLQVAAWLEQPAAASRECSVADADKLTEWLVAHVCEAERRLELGARRAAGALPGGRLMRVLGRAIPRGAHCPSPSARMGVSDQ
jgi:hypothetical protein